MKIMPVIRFLMKYKNRQILRERTDNRMLQSENRILSAYLAIVIENAEKIRVPKETVSEMLGHYRAIVEVEGDDYVISLEKASGGKELYGKGGV